MYSNNIPVYLSKTYHNLCHQRQWNCRNYPRVDQKQYLLLIYITARLLMLLQSVPSERFHHFFFMIFQQKYTYLSEKVQLESISKGKNFVIKTLSIFTHRNLNEQIYLGEELFTSFIIWKSLRTPCTIFQQYHPGIITCIYHL